MGASISIVFEKMSEPEEDILKILICLIFVSSQPLIDNECIIVAHGKGRQQKSILNDTFCEELSFLHLFPTGKYGYQDKRKKTLRAVKYLNQTLLNHTQNIASDAD